MTRYVLDASAVLSLAMAERGADRVAHLLESAECVMSAVNHAEVVGKLQEIGMRAAEVTSLIAGLRLGIRDFDREQGFHCGWLREKTRKHGLSLGDRACLQLASALSATAVTADRAWQKLRLGIEIELLR